MHPRRFPDAEKGLQFADGEVEMTIRSEGRLWEDAEKGIPKGEMHCRSTSDLQRRMASLMVVRRVCFWRSVMANDDDGGVFFPVSHHESHPPSGTAAPEE